MTRADIEARRNSVDVIGQHRTAADRVNEALSRILLDLEDARSAVTGHARREPALQTIGRLSYGFFQLGKVIAPKDQRSGFRNGPA